MTSGEDKTVSYLAADTLLTDYRIFKTVFSPPTLEKSVINLYEGFFLLQNNPSILILHSSDSTATISNKVDKLVPQ